MSELVQVKGLKELQGFLSTFPVKIESNIMRGALRAGANVMLKIAREKCPEGEPSKEGIAKWGHRKGLLKKSIRVSVSMKRGKITAEVKAGGKLKSGALIYYASFLEKGTKAHVIKAGPGKRFPWGGREVKHPGSKAKPFMRPAFDAGNVQALEATRAYIEKRIQQIQITSALPAAGG